MTGEFGPGSVITAMTGTGHASMEETTAAGTRDTATGDSLAAHFATAAGKANSANAGKASGGMGQIESAVLDGHVVLTQQPAAKPGAPAEAPMQATSGHAVYESAGEWLHLTVNPRVENGGMQLTADKVDVSQQSGDAFAHGNVKATWLDTSSTLGGQQARPANEPPRAAWFWVERDRRTPSRPRLNCIRRLARSRSADTRGFGSRRTRLPALDCA